MHILGGYSSVSHVDKKLKTNTSAHVARKDNRKSSCLWWTIVSFLLIYHLASLFPLIHFLCVSPNRKHCPVDALTVVSGYVLWSTCTMTPIVVEFITDNWLVNHRRQFVLKTEVRNQWTPKTIYRRITPCSIFSLGIPWFHRRKFDFLYPYFALAYKRELFDFHKIHKWIRSKQR